MLLARAKDSRRGNRLASVTALAAGLAGYVSMTDMVIAKAVLHAVAIAAMGCAVANRRAGGLLEFAMLMSAWPGVEGEAACGSVVSVADFEALRSGLGCGARDIETLEAVHGDRGDVSPYYDCEIDACVDIGSSVINFGDDKRTKGYLKIDGYRSVKIAGAGDGAVLSGNGRTRMLYIRFGSTVRLEDLMMRDGNGWVS